MMIMKMKMVAWRTVSIQLGDACVSTTGLRQGQEQGQWLKLVMVLVLVLVNSMETGTALEP